MEHKVKWKDKHERERNSEGGGGGQDEVRRSAPVGKQGNGAVMR